MFLEGTDDSVSLVDYMEIGSATARPFTILGRHGEAEHSALDAMWADAGHVAGGLIERGAAGDRVGVIGLTSLDYVVACLAVWRAGMTLVPLPGRGGRISQSEWARIVNQRLAAADVKAVIGQAGAGLLLEALPVSALRGNTEYSDRPSADSLAMIQFSSGTTSQPKGTMLTHRALVARLRLRASSALVPDADEHILRWNPLHTGAAVASVVCQAFARGIEVSVLPTRLFTSDPGRWIREISDRGITHTGGPTFAYDLATRAIVRGLGGQIDLSGWRSATASAEVINPAVLRRFAAAAAPFGFNEEAFQTRYISSEGGFITDGREGSGLRVLELDRGKLSGGEASPSRDGDTLGVLSNGSPLPGVELQITDAHGDPLPERRIGEIWIRSPGVSSGYLGAPVQSEAIFGGSWYRSGDAGFIDGGELFITGRVKDMIIVRGANLYAEDVEAAVNEVLPHVTCCAFGVSGTSSEGVVLSMESPGGELSPDDVSAARAAVWRTLGVSISDVMMIEPGGTYRTDSGKLQRHAMKALYEANIDKMEQQTTSEAG